MMSGENILKGCLVESDPAVIAQARQAKRRALVVAIILQVLLVGLLVLAPLLGAVEKLPQMIVATPTVPYKGGPKEIVSRHEEARGSKKTPVIRNQPLIFQPGRIPREITMISDPPDVIAAHAAPTGGSGITGDPDGKIDLDAPGERRATVLKPPETVKAKPRKSVV